MFVNAVAFTALCWWYRQKKCLVGTNGVRLGGFALLLHKSVHALWLYLHCYVLANAFPRFKPVIHALSMMYVPFWLDGSEYTGRRKKAFIKKLSLWNLLKRRLNLKLVKTTDLADRNYIFYIAPHGVMPWGAFFNTISDVNQFSEKFPHQEVRLGILSFFFWIPFMRDIALWGGVVDVSRYSCRRLLDDGYSLALFPGGAKEALFSNPGKNTIVIKCRKGIFRLALETGTPIIPVYSFRETSQYCQWIPANSSVKCVYDAVMVACREIFGFVPCLVTNVLPRSANVTTVYGSPLHVKQVTNPSEKQVNGLQKIFCDQLQHLFDQHVLEHDPTGEKLILV